MTALVLDHIAAWPTLARSVRMLLGRLGSAIDNAVGALAARKVSEADMREVEKAVRLYSR